MPKGRVEFGIDNSHRDDVFILANLLLKEGYEVLLTQDEFGNVSVGYNKVAWTDETYTLITFEEIDLLSLAKQKKENKE